jgi:hypothetical protein
MDLKQCPFCIRSLIDCMVVIDGHASYGTDIVSVIGTIINVPYRQVVILDSFT